MQSVARARRDLPIAAVYAAKILANEAQPMAIMTALPPAPPCWCRPSFLQQPLQRILHSALRQGVTGKPEGRRERSVSASRSRLRCGMSPISQIAHIARPGSRPASEDAGRVRVSAPRLGRTALGAVSAPPQNSAHSWSPAGTGAGRSLAAEPFARSGLALFGRDAAGRARTGADFRALARSAPRP